MNFLKFFLLFGAIFASCEAFCCRSKLSWKRWNKNDLTYRILNYPSQYRKEYTDFIFQRAFELYNQNAGITFKAKKIGHVDITIRFDRNSEHAIFRMKDAISFSFPPDHTSTRVTSSLMTMSCGLLMVVAMISSNV